MFDTERNDRLILREHNGYTVGNIKYLYSTWTTPQQPDIFDRHKLYEIWRVGCDNFLTRHRINLGPQCTNRL